MRRLVFLAILLSFSAQAKLRQDSKFIARILGVSDSKRTILVNRGEEHGLAKDQHAKISIPTGMIARAVVVKISPSRSIWSVYRFFAKDLIKPQTVATFKIATAVKLTQDESKALGSLAEKVDKKREEIPKDPEFQKEQNQIGRKILESQNITSQFDNVDYSKLQENQMVKPKLDPDLDWSALNGKKDGEGFDATLDYSRLR